MLHGDAAAECSNPIDVARRNRLCMVEEPMQPIERHVAIDRLEHVERAGDRLVIGGVQPPRPASFGEQTDDGLEVGFHVCRHLGPGDAEILEVGGRIDQHLARAVQTVEIVAMPRLHPGGPVGEIGQFLLRLLGEEVVGDPDRHLASAVQILDHRIVVWIILKAAARVHHAGHTEAVQLAHEVARRIELIVRRQLRPLGQRRVEDHRVGLGQQQAGGIAGRIAHDLATRRVGRIPGIADRP